MPVIFIVTLAYVWAAQVPAPVVPGEVQVATASGHTLVMAPDGRVRSLSGIVRVWAGISRMLALKSDGTLYVWGPAGTADGRNLRGPMVMTTFAATAR
jgi:hypothetical protein